MPAHRTPRPSTRRAAAADDCHDGSAATPDPTPPTSAAARRGMTRWSRCTSCRRGFVAASLVNGQCERCAGLQALPLHGEGGRFLPGLTHGPSPSPSRPTAPVRGRRDDDR